MRAITIDRYGSPGILRLQDIAEPVVNDDDVLVRVRAASLNPYDWHVLTGLPYIGRAQFGLRRPRVRGLGADLAGEVEAVGKSVERFGPGDHVYGEVNGEVPGQPMLELGSLAEYVCVKEGSVVHKPTNLTFEQAAAVPLAGHTALKGIRDLAAVQPGHEVLINGASGGVGTFAVQIAKALGAEVTGVCSTGNVGLVRCVGADHVIDYTKTDFTRGDARYDALLDNVGNRSLSECRRVLKPRGVYVASFGKPENRWLGPLRTILSMALLSPFVSQKLLVLNTKRTRDALLDLKELIEAGKVTPVVDRRYPLEDAIDALGYLLEGHARGKVVVSVSACAQEEVE
jgi:NADPH:quinone reductase-like Zn-dependent oxidoreductase